jgi:hypothetical protein
VAYRFMDALRSIAAGGGWVSSRAAGELWSNSVRSSCSRPCALSLQRMHGWNNSSMQLTRAGSVRM